MEGLVEVLLVVLADWDKAFPQLRTSRRAKRLALGFFLAIGRKTVSSAISASSRDQLDWSADYRVLSRSRWSPCALFRPILRDAVLREEDDLVTVGYDDTLVKKTGKKVKGASWQRDSLSPPFSVNFVWGMRYLQASLLVPLYKRDGSTPPRGVPVQFEQLPKFKKPGKNASQEELDKYRDLQKKYNASTCFVKQVRFLRNELNQMGLGYKKLLVVADGSYCNRTCFTADLWNTDIVARARKNARLCFRAPEGSRKFYDPNSFTPDQVRQDPATAYNEAEIFYGGRFRATKYKELREVYWRTGAKRKPLRLIVIAATPYRRNKKGDLLYRNPAYLLTTDLQTDAKTLIQKYFDRWQIEVNFQEEKGLMGLGHQQVWSEQAIPRAPVFVVATYSALLMASIIKFQDKRDPDAFKAIPKWRNRSQRRPSCRDLISLLRKELLERPNTQTEILPIAEERAMIINASG